jgi:hypothetical protein
VACRRAGRGFGLSPGFQCVADFFGEFRFRVMPRPNFRHPSFFKFKNSEPDVFFAFSPEIMDEIQFLGIFQAII